MLHSAPDNLNRMIRRVVESLGYELVGVELLRGGKSRTLLRIYIDQPEGITLDDCGAVSHQVSGVLDVEDPISESYALEVSSPGLDRPLFELAHFDRFKGRRVRVKTGIQHAGRRKFSGTLKGTDGGYVLLEEQGEIFRLPFEQVVTARLVPEL